MRNIKTILITAAVCLPIGFAAAGPLKQHKNLEAARDAIDDAVAKITKAQEANEFDLGGHGKAAKEALDTAKREVHLAADAANAGK